MKEEDGAKYILPAFLMASDDEPPMSEFKRWLGRRISSSAIPGITPNHRDVRTHGQRQASKLCKRPGTRMSLQAILIAQQPTMPSSQLQLSVIRNSRSKQQPFVKVTPLEAAETAAALSEPAVALAVAALSLASPVHQRQHSYMIAKAQRLISPCDPQC